MAPRIVQAGVAISVALFLFAALFFVRTQDAMILIFALQAVFSVWGVLLIVHFLVHGIPVRIVADERRR